MGNSSHPPLRRSWFQFSLSSLFIAILVVAIVLSQNLSVVRKRQAAMQQLNAAGIQVDGPYRTGPGWKLKQVSYDRYLKPTRRPRKINLLIRRLLGDHPVNHIVFPGMATERELEAAANFPEAVVLERIKLDSGTN